MLDKKTVVSTTEPRLTLLQYLKTLDKLLDGASLDRVQVIRLTENLIKLKFVFGDGSEIISEEIKTSGGGAGSVVEANDGTNGTNILGITIDGKRYSLQGYKIDAGDLLKLIQGSDTVTVDLTSDGQRLEVHLDEIFKQTLVTRNELNKPIELPAGVDLLNYNWDAYTNGTWFKGSNAQNMPDGTKGEFLIQLIKSRNTRFAIYLYNTDIYENNTGNYINYHYSDKFEGWQKIQTNLNNDFVKKFTPIYDKDNPAISYGKENGIGLGENISSGTLSSMLKNYQVLYIDTNASYGNRFIPLIFTDYSEGSGIGHFSSIILKNQSSTYSNMIMLTFDLEGNKFSYKLNREFEMDNSLSSYSNNISSSIKITKIVGGDLL